MKSFRTLAGLALAAGIALSGTATLSAQDYRDIHHDYARVNQMRADIARDRARLNEDIRCGRTAAARREAADLARDQRALDAQLRDIRHDRSDVRRDWR
jgi:hypothetical protein